jgi:hypothetical protein
MSVLVVLIAPALILIAYAWLRWKARREHQDHLDRLALSRRLAAMRAAETEWTP